MHLVLNVNHNQCTKFGFYTVHVTVQIFPGRSTLLRLSRSKYKFTNLIFKTWEVFAFEKYSSNI